MATGDESVAEASRGLIGVPETSVWSPVVAVVRTLTMVHVKVTIAVAPEPSDTVSVTATGPPVVGVPEMTPVAPLRLSPAGSVPPSV